MLTQLVTEVFVVFFIFARVVAVIGQKVNHSFGLCSL